MRKLLILCCCLTISFLNAQVDFSSSWEDFFSYNNVKDFVKEGELIYALADNAVFTYNISSGETSKISSVQGLSGETTTSIHFSRSTNRLVIGYETGLVEVIDEDGSITISADIVNFNQSGEKSVNHIFENGGTLYLSTPFAIVEYDINELEFGDTFFIGNNSTDIKVNQITVINDRIYATTQNGIYSADVTSPSLIDFNNWQQAFLGRSYENIQIFNNRIFVTSGSTLYEVVNDSLINIRNFSSRINDLKSSETLLTVTLNKEIFALDASMNQVIQHTANSDFDYTLNAGFIDNSKLYLGTQEFGILLSNFSSTSSFTEIHPAGPVSNDVFSLTAQDNHLWIVYGGYAPNFAPIQRRMGYSHFNGETWVTSSNDPANPFPDFVDVTLDPENANRAFISAFGDTRLINTLNVGGLFEVEGNEILNYYNHLNSELEDIVPNDPTRITIRVSSSAFDSRGNLWLTNIGTPNELKKFSGGSWSSFDISAVKVRNAFGLSEVAVDRSNNIWIGSREDGAIVFNENGNRLRTLGTTPTQGSLPNTNVKTIAVDSDNRIWIGTIAGLAVFNNASGVFDASVVDAQPIIILDDGVPRRLLGEQTVNSIVVDGANNKWFGTDNGGVIYTSPNGQNTLASFSKENSPLPSNRIVKISVDKQSGKVFFATDKGIVAYNSNVSPFGDTLGEVYAYPNPVRRFHNTVTIDGRNGTSLPRGTNVKILDVAGNLVYETNVVEGQELQGGKVVWDKTNLAGNRVASGVYIVLLANEDATETSTTKIAIIN